MCTVPRTGFRSWNPVVACCRDLAIRRFFRGDAALARPEVYRYAEAERYPYAIGLPANQVLERKTEYLLRRPAARPRTGLRSGTMTSSTRAGGWDKPRRVVAKIKRVA